MLFYASKCHDVLNMLEFAPEKYAGQLMLNPNYPRVTIPPECKYIMDSGAFQDVADDKRLSFKSALERQLNFENKLGVKAEAIVSYDRLVDEQLTNGKQVKQRVDYNLGADYVEETIKAAEYLSRALPDRTLVLSNQGTNVKQYVECVEHTLNVSKTGDIIGIGGFCILSRNKQYRLDYFEILKEILPKLQSKKIQRIHIFGMGVIDVLIQTDIICKKYGVTCSYDTSSLELNSVFGRVFNPVPGMIQSIFSREDKYRSYQPAILAHTNIANVTAFWANFDNIFLGVD